MKFVNLITIMTTDLPMQETKQEKWERGKTLLLESLHKPDSRLRGCAHNQECYHELMDIREQVIQMVSQMPNPHAPYYGNN